MPHTSYIHLQVMVSILDSVTQQHLHTVYRLLSCVAAISVCRTLIFRNCLLANTVVTRPRFTNWVLVVPKIHIEHGCQQCEDAH